MRLTLIAAAALAAAPAVAAEPLLVEAKPSVVVSYADLDLATPRGKRLLERRLGGAIEQVCGSYANAREDADQFRVDDCRAEARHSINRQLAQRATTIRLVAR